MSEITIKYHLCFTKDAQDAVFYTDIDCVACVKNGTRGFHVRACGDTKALVWPTAEACNDGHTEPRIVRYGSEWEDVDILTDSDLAAAEDRIEWVNNSWYEIFADDTEDEHVFDGNVFHTVYDAVEDIKAYFERESGRYLPGTYPWASKTAIDLWNDLCAAVGDDDDQNAVLGILAVRLGIDGHDEA